MGYIAVVLLQTLVMPVVFGAATLPAHDAWTIVATFGRWFLFWGVGTRLAVAGIVQLVRPEFTTKSILGAAPEPGARVVVQELGFANVAIGVGGVLGTFSGGGLAAAVTGGLYLGAAGVRHVGSRDMNAKERVATWTDLLVFAAMAAYAVAILVH